MKRKNKTKTETASSGPVYGGDFDFDTIRMIALDLDGTTLTRSGLTRRTKETLEEAIRRGIQLVIATGRVYASLPEPVKKLQGLRYIITSNGAHISDAATGEILYSDCMDPKAVDEVLTILPREPYPVEVFTGGKAYIARNVYEDLAENGSDFMSVKYVMRTRTPVDDIYELMREHKNAIENINVHFPEQTARIRMWERFANLPRMTVTSSTHHNIEIGGVTTSKARALAEICGKLGLELSHVMAFGDSPNDLAMLEECGFGVAMGNATEDIKTAADFVTITNEEEGVAYTVRTLLFHEKDGAPARVSPRERLRAWLRRGK